MCKIVYFHSIQDSAWFESVINKIKSKYALITIEEIEYSLKKGVKLKNSCHITFDDGDKTFYDLIYPFLKKNDIPATIFVSPEICLKDSNFWFQEIEDFDCEDMIRTISNQYHISFETLKQFPLMSILKNLKIDQILSIIASYKEKFNVAKKAPMNMNMAQLKEIDANGLIRIGAHTMNHPILANEENEKCKEEIIASIYLLKEHLGHDIKYFAYPNGSPILDFGAREMNILKKMNCSLAFSTHERNCRLNTNPFSIPRYGFAFGNNAYISTKLVLGEFWDKLRSVYPKTEFKSRKKIRETLRLYI